METEVEKRREREQERTRKMINKIYDEIIPGNVREYLPYRLCDEIRKTVSVHVTNADQALVEEIRIRRRRFSSVIIGGKNIFLRYCADDDEIDEMFLKMCKGSLYAFKDSVNNGYISIGNGVRVGVVGRASTEDGKVVGVSDINTLCIRIPHIRRGVGRELYRLICGKTNGGIMIYSPPGVGKTTLLRSLAKMISSGEEARRTLIIDSRDELVSFVDDKYFCADYLIGYPKDIGIEIAIRSMNAEVIISDEISGTTEAKAVMSAHTGGVLFIASAHASSIDELFSIQAIRELHLARVFGYYVGISRKSGVADIDFDYTIHTWKEADEYFD